MHGVLLKLMLMLNPMLLQADQAQLIREQDSGLPLQWQDNQSLLHL